MATERIIPGEIRIFLNHIYEFKKGVRNMVLYTMSKEHEEFACVYQFLYRIIVYTKIYVQRSSGFYTRTINGQRNDKIICLHVYFKAVGIARHFFRKGSRRHIINQIYPIITDIGSRHINLLCGILHIHIFFMGA